MEITLKRELVVNKTACRIAGLVIFVILTSLGAFVRIPLPFTPVPITLQTFFVSLSGAALGPVFGGLSQISYVLLGVFGLPIFSKGGSGMSYLFGPTGGYLFGFILSSLFIARFIKNSRSYIATLLIFCLGDFILLSCGVVWLKVILGYPLSKVLLIGFLPFIPGDLVKASAAALIYSRVRNRLKEIF